MTSRSSRVRGWLGSGYARPVRNGSARRLFPALALEWLEDRTVPAFSVVNADVFGGAGLRLVADFNQPVNAATVQTDDLLVDGSQPASSVNLLDADSVEFLLPALPAGAHSLTIAGGAISDSLGTGLDPFTRSFASAAAAQYAVNHNPRLQPGNAPLTGFAGSALDRVDVLWQTIPGGTGTQDTFAVAYRAVGAASWQTASLGAPIETGVEGRVVRAATVTGLNWNSDYEYRVRHLRADVIVGQYQSTFHTRLQAGDQSSFTFAAYGDSAAGTATGFRQVQGRINQIDPAFAVLLGDNIYDAGSHRESDARFDPGVNPEAAAWMAGHIDYLGVGNHDIGTSSGLPSEQNYSVPIPVAGVTAPAAPPASERPEHSYSWDYGDVHFVTFDTNSLSSTPSARLDGLLDWVVADLNASTARWKIVYGHHPLAGVSDKPESPSDYYYQQVVNRLKAAGVDLFMTGHSHSYAWTYPLTGQISGTATYVNHGSDDQFIAGEGLTQLVSGVGGREVRPVDFSAYPFVAEGFSSTTAVPGRLGFSRVGVTHDQLTVSYVAADDGAVIDSFTITKDNALQTATFQQGVNGYAGTVDTFLHENTPTTSNATAPSLKVDNDDPAGTARDAQALLRFDNLFGGGSGQIPTNVTLRSATLQLQVTNSGNGMNLHRMLTNWAATDTWNSLVGGVQNNGTEAVVAPDTSTGAVPLNVLSFNVLASLQAWLANPSANRGWVFLPTGTDGVDFNSAEGTVKPKLIVTYVLAPNAPPVAANDTATTNGGTPVTVSVLGNDSDPNGDVLSVQSATQPAHGTRVVNANGTITYTPAAGWFGPDSFGYTISDGRGGTANATVTVTTVQTVSFQQGVNGYAGTVDTFLQQNTPTANNSAATSLNVDGDEPAGTGLDAQALLRFNNLFGGAAGQVPLSATLVSATLQLQVTNSGNSMTLHRMLSNWAATDTWNSLVGGVQNNGVDAVAASDVASGAVAVGVLSIDVSSSVRAWLANPSANRGWVFLPTGTDGVDFNSAEGTVKPKLIVTYVPNKPPTVSDIANQATDEDTATGAIAFTVGDVETLPGALTVTATSSNTALVPNANLVLAGSGANRTLTATPASNLSGTTTVTVTVTDGGGATATDTFVLTVNPVNDPPAVAPIANGSLDEGGTIIRSGSFSDPDAGNDWTATVDYGDGSGVRPLPLNPSGTFSLSHAYADDGTYTVAVTVKDQAGAEASAQVQVAVASVAPTATLASDGPVTYGGEATVSFASPHDPSPADAAAGFLYSFSLDGVNFSAPAASSSARFILAAGDQEIFGRVIDKDGDSTRYSTAVTVNKATLTVDADDKARVYGQANPALTASYLGFVNGDTIAVLSGAPTLSTTAAPTSAPGAYPITAAVGTLAAANYRFAFTGGDLTVGRAATAVALAVPTAPLAGDAVTLSAAVSVVAPGSGSPTGTVAFYDGTTALGAVALGDDGSASLALGAGTLAAGTHAIRAVYSGDGNFLGGERSGPLAVLAPSTVQGMAFADFNNDGQIDFGDKGIAGVTVTLTGVDDLGGAVSRTAVTDADGVFAFVNLRPSDAAGYTLREIQPPLFVDGKDTPGVVNGAATGAAGDDAFTGLVLPAGALAEDYNFGERPPAGGSVAAGQTAEIGFWQNKHGQNLIRSLNGGPTSTQLGDWLAATFPNVYGALAGRTNAEVATYYKTLFALPGQTAPGGPPKTDAQVMATALSVYVTNQTLAGSTAAAYGFEVTETGVGTRTFNVGTNGAAFGVANGSRVSVLDLLLAVNSRSKNGLLYDLDGSGQVSAAEAALRGTANDLFSALNAVGSI